MSVKLFALVITQSAIRDQWRNDGVAAASSDGCLTGGRGPLTVLEFLVINVCVLRYASDRDSILQIYRQKCSISGY